MLLRSMSLLFPSCLAVVDAPTVAASLQGCLFTTMLWDSGDSEGGEGGKGNEGSEGGAFTDGGVDDLRLAVLSHCMARPPSKEQARAANVRPRVITLVIFSVAKYVLSTVH